MTKIQNDKNRHKRLKIFGISLLVLVLGWFIYKYSYIYLERRKYAQAELAINKVADDLRVQGINTEFSKGCGKAEGVFGPGALSCSIVIKTASDGTEVDEVGIYKKVGTFVILQGFKFYSDKDFSISNNLATNHSDEFIFEKNGLGCELSNSHPVQGRFIIYFTCVKILKFNIY